MGIIMKSIAIILSLYGMLRTAGSLMFLTYFTNLSNIFVDVVLGYFLVGEIRALQSGQKPVYSNLAYRVKFLATISITLTFLVYMLILAPNSRGGILNAYFGYGAGSFCVHFANPVLSIVDFLLLDYEFESTKKDAFYGVIPPLCYVAMIMVLSTLGLRWGNMYAPYNFLNYGAPVGWFGFDLSQMSGETFGVGVFYMIAVLVLIFIGLGKMFLFLKDLRRKKMVP